VTARLPAFFYGGWQGPNRHRRDQTTPGWLARCRHGNCCLAARAQSMGRNRAKRTPDGGKPLSSRGFARPGFHAHSIRTPLAHARSARRVTAAARNRPSRALRLRSPRDTPLRSDTGVLLLRVRSEPEQRIRRTSSHPGPTRKTTYYAALRYVAARALRSQAARNEGWPSVLAVTRCGLMRPCPAQADRGA
jgi:hypothetical protein